MKRLRIYLDTSVINFLFADDAPDFRRVTVEFFDRYAARYELYVSEIVLLEIGRTSDHSHRDRLLEVIRTRAMAVLAFDPRDEIIRLADEYRKQGAIPEAKEEDALHVAHATVHEMDILLSWHFKHLANVRREARIEAINKEQGYWRPLRVVSPLEVEDEG
jgi:predicted nucleic acid-binding protein